MPQFRLSELSTTIGGNYEKIYSGNCNFAYIVIDCLLRPKTPPKDTGDASNSQSEGIIRLDEGEWPVNEYTEGLPVPTGTVAWAMLDTEHGNFSISIAGIDENDYDNYMELLIQEGFSVVENVSEKIKGENYVSVGTLLSNGEKGLSISYIPDNLTIYVSFEIRLVQSK